jgi:hypothetical protein
VTKTFRFPALVLATVALVATAANARAQSNGIAISAPQNARTSIASGEVATMAFGVRNSGQDTTVAEPKLIVPDGWRIVLSPASTVIAPGERDIWLVSVKAPANAAAGDYAIRVQASRQGVAATATQIDSVIVSIAERHEVAVHPVGALSYVMGGESYTGTFIVKNLGNVAARYDLSARSTQGNTPSLVSEVIALAPGQSDTIRAKVLIPTTVSTTVEETLLLSAVDVVVDSVRGEASLQATVVPSAKAGPTMWTVPTEIALRSGSSAAGVSAFTANGYGKLTQNSDVMVDFLVRGPTGKTSLFGEQETYHLGLATKRANLSIGDDSYGFSRLLTSGGRGTGIEAHTALKGYDAGAYIQRDRSGSGATEFSAMLGTDAKRPVSASLVALNRSSAGGSAQAITFGSNADIFNTNIAVELAASDSQQTSGGAASLHLRGKVTSFNYDVSAQKIAAGFASSQHGTSDLRASLFGHQTGSMTLSGSSTFRLVDAAANLSGFGQRVSTTNVNATWTNGMNVEAEHYDRKDVGGIDAVDGQMETLRLRSHYAIGLLDASMHAQTGLVAQRDSATHGSLTTGISLTARLQESGYVSLFTDMNNGRGLGETGTRSVTTGITSQFQHGATSLRVASFATRALGEWAMQSDVTVERSVRRSIIALRARTMSAPTAPSTHGFFLEVRTPLGLPTAPLNTIGRARAEVVDGETGRGIAGALVRLGGQAAVTDAQGVATFRDLKPGRYRAMIDGAAVAGRVVASGSDVVISATSRQPTAFRMNVSRGAQILVRVRSFERTSATIANGGDTLTEVGAVGQMMVALVTPTDTLWQSSDERGRVDFGAVAPGTYVVAIPRYDVKDHMILAKSEFVVEAQAGQQHQVDFKLVPEVRAVEFQGEAVLIAVPVTARKAAPAPSTITGKPETNPITGKPDQQAPITVKPTTAAPVTSLPITTPARGQRQNQNQNPQKNESPRSE